MVRWLFAPGHPLEDAFHELLLLLAGTQDVKTVAMWALREIQRNPQQGRACTVDGEAVYVYTTGRYQLGETVVPPLLVMYVLDVREHVIYPLSVCRANDVTFGASPPPQGDWMETVPGFASIGEHRDDPAPEPVEQHVRRVLRRTRKTQPH